MEKNDSVFYLRFWYSAVLIKGFLNKINSETGHSFFVIINMTTKVNFYSSTKMKCQMYF